MKIRHRRFSIHRGAWSVVACLSAAPATALASHAPTLEWATYYGDGIDGIDDLAATDDGVVVIGDVGSEPTLFATPGAHQEHPGSESDAFMAYFDAAGKLRWATYYGGGGDEHPGVVVVDRRRGAIYFVGMTASADAIATPGAHQTEHVCAKPPAPCELDLFIARFDLDGHREWATYYGGTGTEEIPVAAAVDAAGNLFLCGTTTSKKGLTTPGSHQPKWHKKDTFPTYLAKFDEHGDLQWGTYYGAGCSGLAIDEARDAVYVAGDGPPKRHHDLATPGAHQRKPAGLNDGFLSRFTGDGEHVWGTFYGGPGRDRAAEVAVDGKGGVYLLGETDSSDGIASEGAHQDAYGGGLHDLFLAKLEPDGERVWATYIGGVGSDAPGSLATVHAWGRSGVYVTARARSPGLATAGAPRTELLGKSDGLFAEFAGDGSLEWSTYFGGSDEDGAHSIDISPDGLIYLLGSTRSPDGIATEGAYQTELTGVASYYIAQFSDESASGGCRIAEPLSGGALALLVGLVARRRRRAAVG
jgi:hypothetical protein